MILAEVEWTTLLNYGLPTALLVYILYWGRPKADKLIDAHAGLVEGLKQAVAAQTATQSSQTRLMKAHGRILKEQVAIQKDNNALLRDIYSRTVGTEPPSPPVSNTSTVSS